MREDLTGSQAQRMTELGRAIKELRRANDILKLASAPFAHVEQGSRLKSWGHLSTSTAMPMGSSRSSGSCRLALWRIVG